MRQDFLLSFVLHFVLATALVISVPFQPRVKLDMSDVIKVSLTSMPYAPKLNTQAAVLPKPVSAQEQPELVPDTKSASKAKAVDKPKPKKKEEKRKKTCGRKRTRRASRERIRDKGCEQ